jgi:hypothetical protein
VVLDRFVEVTLRLIRIPDPTPGRPNPLRSPGPSCGARSPSESPPLNDMHSRGSHTPSPRPIANVLCNCQALRVIVDRGVKVPQRLERNPEGAVDKHSVAWQRCLQSGCYLIAPRPAIRQREPAVRVSAILVGRRRRCHAGAGARSGRERAPETFACERGCVHVWHTHVRARLCARAVHMCVPRTLILKKKKKCTAHARTHARTYTVTTTHTCKKNLNLNSCMQTQTSYSYTHTSVCIHVYVYSNQIHSRVCL